MIKDTNPDHYKVDGANFIKYINDPKISGFGNWMFANGFNSGVWESMNWISVKDKLPHDQDIVIVAINDDSGDTPYKYTYFGWYMSEAKCWIVDDEIRRGEVYAWRPLPEPPKEDGDGSN